MLKRCVNSCSKYIGVCLLFAACARAPIRDATEAMRPTKAPDSRLQDDMGLVDLSRALEAQVAQLRRGDVSASMQFGPVKITRAQYASALQELSQSLKDDPTGAKFYSKIKSEFDFYEVYGDKKWSEVFVTSYFEPVIRGSKKKTPRFNQPLYGYPRDMITVNLNAFAQTQTTPTAVTQYARVVADNIARDGLLRGRLAPASQDPGRQTVLPYYSRKEIEGQNTVLKNKSEILCYVDPVDAFFLQIQGSGRVDLAEGGTLQLGYAGQNGHPYRAIGQTLFHVIPKETMSAQKIERHLRELTPAAAKKVMHENPSYVFFKKIDSEPVTSFGNEVQAGRTIATDPRYFPKGAFGFLIYQRPQFPRTMSDLLIAEAEAKKAQGEATVVAPPANSTPTNPDAPMATLPAEPREEMEEPVEFVTSSRFVLDQDTGGAIRGPHRVDLFWGRGREAAKVSGVMRHPGKLYYLVPRNAL